MIDRPEKGERAVLVHIHFPAGNMQEDLNELQELALSAGADRVQVITGTKPSPDPKYFVGTGKADEIRQAVLAHKANIVIFNHRLSPAQERNLERLCQCRVIDRIGLILDIFAQRAQSFEGKLQVELALLKHLSTRLVRGWTHLERQRGGIGLRGPGETQLETDRRLIRSRIKLITARLAKVQKLRAEGRRLRKRNAVPTIALVGYTNAGKSTLFNRLTKASVYVADRLFATLDPTLRRLDIPERGAVILADTVGFIRHLPHDLISAFHATLEEVSQANLLLHVVDAADPRRDSNIIQVQSVLEEIGAGMVPQLLVYNKIDLCAGVQPGFDRDRKGYVNRLWVSATQNRGLEELKTAMSEMLGDDIIQRMIELKPTDAELRATLYQLDSVVSEEIQEDGSSQLVVRMPKAKWDKLM